MNRDVAAQSLWKAAGLFDKAGLTPQSIGAYQRYAKEYPTDAQVPEALLSIGQLYQSLGQFAQAIPYLQRNLTEHPNTTPAYMSSVQLARCYMALGDKQYPLAEQTLLSVVQDSKTLSPDAAEFRASLFTLGELYYRNAHWSDAILRLEEAITRYPEDPGAIPARFWLADSYRKSAGSIAEALAKEPTMPQRDALEQARHERLLRAGQIFAEVITTLEDTTRQVQDLSPLEQDYLHYSYLYRADCSFDLKDYATAIKLYDVAANRYGQSVTAIEAYLQIINAYLAMKEPTQAAAAAERARWALKHIPDDAFGKTPLALSRTYYEDVLRIAKP